MLVTPTPWHFGANFKNIMNSVCNPSLQGQALNYCMFGSFFLYFLFLGEDLDILAHEIKQCLISKKPANIEKN